MLPGKQKREIAYGESVDKGVAKVEIPAESSPRLNGLTRVSGYPGEGVPHGHESVGEYSCHKGHKQKNTDDGTEHLADDAAPVHGYH